MTLLLAFKYVLEFLSVDKNPFSDCRTIYNLKIDVLGYNFPFNTKTKSYLVNTC